MLYKSVCLCKSNITFVAYFAVEKMPDSYAKCEIGLTTSFSLIGYDIPFFTLPAETVSLWWKFIDKLKLD